MNLSGKTAIVTGASFGLGKAIAQKLAEAGVTVFAMARSIEKTNLSAGVIKIPLNIRDLAGIDEAFGLVDAQVKSIDILVNCAGRIVMKPFEETSRDEIMDVLGVNLKGNIYIAQEAYKRMLPQKSGHIVNVLSTSALKGRENETIYTASKWGLRGFTESLRLEAKPYNIRVTSVCPGGMSSENFWQVVPGKDFNSYMKPELVADQIVTLLQSDPTVIPSELVIERY